MKKTITWLLLVVMLLGIFSGCANQEATPTNDPAASGDAEGINAAIDYLKAFYKDAGNETFADFERFGVVRIGGVAYTVVWTADVSEDLVKAVVNEDGTVTIDVNESNETETPYNLTATVTDDAGNTASHSWNYILPVGMGDDYGAIVDMGYALENGQALDYDSTLVGTVTAINTAWSDEYKNITVTIIVEGREDKPIMCYRLKGDGAQDLAVGDLITVTGKLKNYNGTIEFDSGCTLDKVEKGAGTLGDVPTDPHEIIDAAYALEVGASLPYSATLTGEVTSIDDPFSTQYNNITVSIKVEGREDKPIKCYRLKGEGADQIMPGDTITVTGVIKNYNGTIEFDSGCSLVELVKGENSFVMPTDPKEIVKMAFELKPGEALPVPVTLTGVIFKIDDVFSTKYNNVSVWIDVEGMVNNPILCFRLKGADADKIWLWDTITVSGVLKNYNGTIEFDAGCTLESFENTGGEPKAPTTPQEVVDVLYGLEDNELFPGMYCIYGRVVDAGEFSYAYGNQTIKIEVEGREGKYVTCYRMSNYFPVYEGDYITVTGNLENYKGSPQMTNSYPVTYDETTFAEAYEEAKGLEYKEYLFYNTSITGTISEVDYSSKYKNVSFYVTDDEGNKVFCFRPSGYGADKLVDGDVVTVTGPLTPYWGVPQFDSKSTFVCDRLIPKTWAEQYEAAKSLANNNLLPIDSTFTGVITEITEPYSSFKNISFKVMNADGQEILCYRLTKNDVDELEVGDTVTIVGPLTAFKGTPQFNKASVVTIVAKGEPSVQPNPEEVKTLAEQIAATENLKNDEYLTAVTSTIEGEITEVLEEYTTQYKNFSFKVKNADGIELTCWRLTKDGVDSLKAGDIVTVTGNLVNYNGSAQFDKTATVTLVKAGEGGSEGGNEGGEDENLTAYTLSFKDKANRTVFNTSQQVWAQNGITVTNDKDQSTSNVADYANPARFYKNTKVTITFAGMKKIEIDSASGEHFTNLKNSLTAAGIAYTVSGTVVTITLDSAVDAFTFNCTGGQCRFYNITVYA